MPGIRLTVSGSERPELTERLATELTQLTCEVLSKRPAKMAVIVEYVPHAQWFIDNRSLVAHGKNAFQLVLTITQHTNIREEKAEYHRKAFELLSTLIGDVHPHSNIHVVECDAVGYGFGGVTLEWRIHHGDGAVPA
ncbi:tautomerase family protein [Pararobbsia silviterrae]|uniref:4-oxalocrotonate tautomerase n=1 Tax=Pararobbsia silviterrae TaxID=1792498 RepID=A0A494Y631_9BURK|nr:tautomerase family protein [Pararobbsia silviterrae]RKP57753.1 4-oxalocrotonate tautomerase [Pararobbsia silviterrae]